MKIYLVGGAVRDKLLGLPVKERDWVVVGAKPEELLRLGYKQVGKEFPVFLHPQTAEEYALARMERKVAPGYTGFVFDTSPEVTLEEDLLRRDLTINAMAETLEGDCIDPYHGREDLAKKILRHVSPAFSEDPVRILRVARFAARYGEQGFTLAPETKALMKEMVACGEVKALVPERVWKEFERALGEQAPTLFFQTLAACEALPILFPQLELTGPGMKALKQATPLTKDPLIRFAVLMHASSKEDILALSQHYRFPVAYRELARLVSEYNGIAAQFSELSAEKLLSLLLSLDAFRREERFKQFLLTCELISKEKFPRKAWETSYQVLKQIDVADWLRPEMKGPEIAEKLKQKRLAALEVWLKNSKEV